MLLFIFSHAGCALFKDAKVSTDPDLAKDRVCLTSEGKGRFVFEGQKHVFSFQSSLVEEELRWTVLIDFPVYGRESIEIEWDLAKNRAFTQTSYEQALLKNSRNLNPALLEAAMEMWVQFFEDLLLAKDLLEKDFKQKIRWSVRGKELVGRLKVKQYQARISFLNPIPNGHFGRFDFELFAQDKEKLFGMELLVRNCLEKTE